MQPNEEQMTQMNPENAYLEAVKTELCLPWTVHLEHFGGDQEPETYGDRPGYLRQIVWAIRNDAGIDVNAAWFPKGQDLFAPPLRLTEAVIYEENLDEHPNPEGSLYRKRLQAVVDAMNGLVELDGRTSE